jgi:predicted transcriptional regulator
MPFNETKQNLEKLGLSPNDVAVYLELVKIGSSQVGPLISKTQLHRNIVYTSLDHLVALKLVAETSIRGKKTYNTASPQILAEDFLNKAELAKQVVSEIEKMAQQPVQEITIHQGNEEFILLQTSIIHSLPKGSTKYIIGTGGEEFMANTMRPVWKKYHKAAHEQHLKIKMIGYASQRSSFLEEVSREGIYDVRFIPKSVENPAGIHVYPDAGITLNIIYSDQNAPITAIKIKNAKLTQGYLNFFDNLWASGEK